MGALLGFPLTVLLLVLCFRHIREKTGPDLRDARAWLGFLVIGLANGGVVWLLLS
jgi:hypothetical protein